MIEGNEEKLTRIIKNQDWLMDALKDVRALRLPDWYIAAGAVRNTVWNYSHEYPTDSYQEDIDVVYFDPSSSDLEKDLDIWNSLKKINPDLDWDITNQARMNSKGPGLKSSCESMTYWSETPTCVGVRLEENDEITICAPHSLDDLMNLVVRPIPKPYQNLSLYRERIAEKNWDKIWPKLDIRYL